MNRLSDNMTWNVTFYVNTFFQATCEVCRRNYNHKEWNNAYSIDAFGGDE